ncbi:MAG: DUF4160 domain-containing protein [Prosthecobacter sp.]|nr:DUF4160 domain-containing protein [Prosthecobacter sp.]
MPTISRFHGIRIMMHAGERAHPPPHFHAQSGSRRAAYQIADGRRLAGSLPVAAERLLREWSALNRMALEENWRRAREDKPLKPDPPL